MKLAADILLPGHHFGMVTEPVAGSDAFVLTTLGFLGFLFGAFTVAAIVLWRRQAHPEPHRRLLMELEDQQQDQQTTPREATNAPGVDDEPQAQPWERKADWWKNSAG